MTTGAIGRLRSSLPEGTAVVGAGLFVGGASAYVFFKIGQLALGQDGFKPIVALWFVVFTLAPGFLLPIEQEASRAIAHRRATGEGYGPVVRRMAGLATAVVAALLVFVAAAAPALTDHLFEGSSVVTVCLVLSLVAAAPMHLLRGTCSGGGAFGSYAAIVALDGGVRVAACAALWLAGVDAPGPYALAVAASPLLAAVAVAGTRRPVLADGPPAALSDVAPNLGWLLVGQLFASALINAGPITVDLLGTGSDPAAVTRFGNAVIFARIPLFLFQAVQAALLPKLASLAAASDLGEFRDGLRRLVAVVSTIGAAGVAGAWVVGPPILELVYDTTVDGRTLMLLALSSALVMLALSVAQAVVALGGHSRVALGWMAGFACYVLVAWLAADGLYLRVELALVASAATVLAVLAASLRRLLAAR